MSKTEEKVDDSEEWYLVPELEIKIHKSWLELVKYCQDNLPFGELRLQVNNAQPGRRLKEIPNIRFDKSTNYQKNGSKLYYVKSLDLHVSESWVDFVQWCQNYFVSGILEIKLVSGQPTDLLGAKQKVDFTKPETIPPGIPFDFSKVSW